ncbi:MAG: hypothetical protein K0S57_1440 [Ramlibacter sp.]|nr:hypothetical protein [Ramlibacter sp.]
MRVAAYILNGQPGVGRVSADGRQVEPFQLSAAELALGALPIVEAQAAGRALPAVGKAIGIDQVKLTAPIPRPRRNVFCVGKNYHAHAKEFAGSGFDSSAKSGGDIPSAPIIFSKVPESVTGPTDDILFPAEVSTAIDYEAELTVVIGKGGKGIKAADAMKHVWGYTIINDVTARDWQGKHSQWLLGKSFDNGELRQDANTKDFIFDIPTLIECISAGITLYPGDLIATGTPAGVGIGYKPPKYLVRGDVVRIEIAGIGSIENAFK